VPFRIRSVALLVVLGVAALVGIRSFVIVSASRSCPGAMATPDTPSYELPAQSLAQLGRFLETPDPAAPAETTRTPGYPLFLALHRVWQGPGRALAALDQMLCFALGLAVLLRAYGARASRPEVVIALWLAALDPVSAALSARINSDVLFAGALALLTPALSRLLQNDRELATPYAGRREGGRGGEPAVASAGPGPRTPGDTGAPRGRLIQLPIAGRWFWIGVGCGGLALVRPIAYFLPFALFLVPAAGSVRRGPRPRPSLRPWIWVFTGWALVCGGWQLRNHFEADTWEMSTVTGRNLYRYRAAGVVSLRDGIPFAAARDTLMKALPDLEGLSSAETSRLFREAALPILRDHPGLTLRVSAEGIGRMFLVPGETALLEMFCIRSPAEGALGDLRRLSPEGYAAKWLGENRRVFLAFAGALAYLAVLLGGAALGMAALVRSGRWSALHTVLAIEIVYFAILSAGPEAEPRFRLPVGPALAVFAATGIDRLRLAAWCNRRPRAHEGAASR
jgi:hypothetical protein